MKVDIVYTWVDGSDAEWSSKKNDHISVNYDSPISPESIDKKRFSNNQELKCSLRTVFKNAPWINRIFIVTDKQVPDWLSVNNKITIVDHQEIIPKKYLPTFNSSVIEAHIHNISKLSEHFIYFNDDMFIGRHSRPEDFFKGGTPRVFTSSIFQKLNKKRRDVTYNVSAIDNSREIVGKRLGIIMKYGFRHGVRPMLKSRMKLINDEYKSIIHPYFSEKFRATPFSLLYLYAFHELAIGKAKATYKKNVKKCNYIPYDFTFTYVSNSNIEFFDNNFEKLRPLIFCINESKIDLMNMKIFKSGRFSSPSEAELNVTVR